MRQFCSLSAALNSRIVPKLTLKSLSLVDARVEDIQVLCYTLPEEYGFDGVIGLNFLRHSTSRSTLSKASLP